jgi:hypothetical protein
MLLTSYAGFAGALLAMMGTLTLRVPTLTYPLRCANTRCRYVIMPDGLMRFSLSTPPPHYCYAYQLSRTNLRTRCRYVIMPDGLMRFSQTMHKDMGALLQLPSSIDFKSKHAVMADGQPEVVYAGTYICIYIIYV